jgi:Reverse transcriptase (RNA-dependent DNA polymerase)
MSNLPCEAMAHTQQVSHVMQQGDCNAPATFQRLMTWIFREHLGIFIRVYLDDIFVYSDTIEDHEGHL